MKRLNFRGYGYVELCIGMLILSLFAEMLAVARLVMAKKTVALEDQSYAQLKAIQMMEELKSAANQNPWYGATALDSYNDVNGSHANPVLTTDKTLDKPEGGAPGDPLSGNHQDNGHWRYLRRIQVNAVDGDPNARDVIIKVWKFASDSDPLVPGILLATLEETVKADSNAFRHH